MRGKVHSKKGLLSIVWLSTKQGSLPVAFWVVSHTTNPTWLLLCGFLHSKKRPREGVP